MIARSLSLSVALAVSVTACSDAGDPREYAKQVAEEQRKPRPASKIVKIQTPVPPRAKIACEQWISIEGFFGASGFANTRRLCEVFRRVEGDVIVSVAA